MKVSFLHPHLSLSSLSLRENCQPSGIDVISNLVSKIRAQDAEQKATLVKIDNLSAKVQAQEASISQLALLLDQQARLVEKNLSHPRGLRGSRYEYDGVE